MLLPRPFIGYLAREITKGLAERMCEFRNPDAVREKMVAVIVDELSLEDEINTEARELLNQYADYMRTQRIPYQEMFWKVKRKILAERKMVSAQAREPGERKMKISRDKTVEMSHKLAAALPRIPGTLLRTSWNDVRLEIARLMQDILMKEEAIDKQAQKKVSTIKRDIPEGSEEWTLLYRRYYDEEMKRYGIDLTE
ncbi:MAG: DUF507 family protein [Bryobacterales bacterium]|jgi:hypothetical protein